MKTKAKTFKEMLNEPEKEFRKRVAHLASIGAFQSIGILATARAKNKQK